DKNSIKTIRGQTDFQLNSNAEFGQDAQTREKHIQRPETAVLLHFPHRDGYPEL
ncbi:hypothetical protein M9458_049185, partial [Cirrhinus mrigala]